MHMLRMMVSKPHTHPRMTRQREPHPTHLGPRTLRLRRRKRRRKSAAAGMLDLMLLRERTRRRRRNPARHLLLCLLNNNLLLRLLPGIMKLRLARSDLVHLVLLAEPRQDVRVELVHAHARPDLLHRGLLLLLLLNYTGWDGVVRWAGWWDVLVRMRLVLLKSSRLLLHLLLSMQLGEMVRRRVHVVQIFGDVFGVETGK